MAEVLARYRPLEYIRPPATLDGGDVLRVGKTVFVGVSSRTTEAGVEQLRVHLQPFGYDVRAVMVSGCLHLKTAAAEVADDTVLINPAWVGAEVFAGLDVIDGDPREIATTSTMRVGDAVLMTSGAPRTREALEELGCRVREIDYSELAKAEAGLTCCSVILDTGTMASSG